MRMWSSELFEVLDDKRINGQWKEVCMIAGSLAKKGTPNHLLVNQVVDYTCQDFSEYCIELMVEREKRGFKTTQRAYDNLFDNIEIAKDNNYFSSELIQEVRNEYEDWFDEEYLAIQYFNLREKWRRGGVSDEDWQKFDEYARDRVIKYVSEEM